MISSSYRNKFLVNFSLSTKLCSPSTAWRESCVNSDSIQFLVKIMEYLVIQFMLGFKKVLKMGRSTHLEVPSRFASSHNFLKFRSKNQSKVVKFDSFSSYEENKLKAIFASTRISFVCDKADLGLALSIQKTLSFIAVASSFD